MPFVLVVASGAPELIALSTYDLLAAAVLVDGVGTTGELINVLTPAMVSSVLLCTTDESLALSLRDALKPSTFGWEILETWASPTLATFSVPSELCDTPKKSLRTTPHMPSSAPGEGSLAMMICIYSLPHIYFFLSGEHKDIAYAPYDKCTS
jgi:hypothetical protein